MGYPEFHYCSNEIIKFASFSHGNKTTTKVYGQTTILLTKADI
uniref:Uncharacterized protein n=1 Tax=Arundo donax TaxID=35708 RepID=A0A0A9C4X6_ARUDO